MQPNQNGLHTEIHPSSISLLSRSGRRGSSFRRGPQTFLFLASSVSSDWGILRHSQVNAEISSLHLDLGLPRGLPPAGRRQPGGILTRYLNHLSWLLSIQRSSGFTLSPSRITELLTLSLREMPGSLLRKSISAACSRDLILSVMTHPS